jgi:hypothetical protein
MRTEVEIANELFEAREAEKQANERRVELEEELIALLGQKEEGSQTHEVGDYKVIITGKLIRNIDWDMYDKAIAAKIPESLQPVKVKRELDDSGVKYLANNEPQIYRLLAKALTIKPAKTAVKISKGA